jgi:hypothetical protein
MSQFPNDTENDTHGAIIDVLYIASVVVLGGAVITAVTGIFIPAFLLSAAILGPLGILYYSVARFLNRREMRQE